MKKVFLGPWSFWSLSDSTNRFNCPFSNDPCLTPRRRQNPQSPCRNIRTINAGCICTKFPLQLCHLLNGALSISEMYFKWNDFLECYPFLLIEMNS